MHEGVRCEMLIWFPHNRVFHKTAREEIEKPLFLSFSLGMLTLHLLGVTKVKKNNISHCNNTTEPEISENWLPVFIEREREREREHPNQFVEARQYLSLQSL
jgi:hypothetical protein